MYPYGAVWNGFHWWWIIPMAMMVLCFIMMRGHGGCLTGWSGLAVRIRQRHPGQTVRPRRDRQRGIRREEKAYKPVKQPIIHSGQVKKFLSHLSTIPEEVCRGDYINRLPREAAWAVGVFFFGKN